MAFLLRHFADCANNSRVLPLFYELCMVVGFNHNFRYKGELFHVQTEDSGLKSPHIITLLYRGGTILASRKTSYADITKIDRLEQVVEELMKEQHRDMLRRLKAGEFDEIIAGRRPVAALADTPRTAAPVPAAAVSAPPSAVPPGQKAETLPAQKPEAPPRPTPVAGREPQAGRRDTSLDEIILSYLLGDGEDTKKT